MGNPTYISTIDSNVWILIGFVVLILVSLYFDNKWSETDVPIEFRQTWYIILISALLAWGVNLMLSNNWFLVISALGLILFAGIILVETTKKKRTQSINNQVRIITIVVTELNKNYKRFCKRGREGRGKKRALKRPIEQINNQQTAIDITNADKELTKTLKGQGTDTTQKKSLGI